MSKQTAVEWLVKELSQELDYIPIKQRDVIRDLVEKAKQMEREQMGYTKEDVLKAGEIGEINHHDYEHIVSLLDEAREINRQNQTI